MNSMELEAGRDLDALIAERVMGGRVVKGGQGEMLEFFGTYPNGFYALPRPYSTDIKFAWRVVENMAARGWKIDVQNRFPPTWACHVNFAAPNYRRVFETAESAPLVICRAALAAIEATQ